MSVPCSSGSWSVSVDITTLPDGNISVELDFTLDSGTHAVNHWTFVKNAGATGAHKIFVTSTATNGNIGGLIGADAICAARATAGGLTGTYVAILSTSTVDAKDRFAAATTIVNTNGNVVANDETDLFDGNLQNFIGFDEFADNSSGSLDTWTGTSAAGTNIGQNCSDWTSNGGGDSGRYGLSGSAIMAAWVNNNAGGCAFSKHLYCISTTPQP